jgi:hypothetical protein
VKTGERKRPCRLDIPAWNETRGGHSGVTMFTVLSRDILTAKVAVTLRQAASLVASIASTKADEHSRTRLSVQYLQVLVRGVLLEQ